MIAVDTDGDDEFIYSSNSSNNDSNNNNNSNSDTSNSSNNDSSNNANNNSNAQNSSNQTETQDRMNVDEQPPIVTPSTPVQIDKLTDPAKPESPGAPKVMSKEELRNKLRTAMRKAQGLPVKNEEKGQEEEKKKEQQGGRRKKGGAVNKGVNETGTKKAVAEDATEGENKKASTTKRKQTQE